jgi:hypothetical protein
MNSLKKPECMSFWLNNLEHILTGYLEGHFDLYRYT